MMRRLSLVYHNCRHIGSRVAKVGRAISSRPLVVVPLSHVAQAIVELFLSNASILIRSQSMHIGNVLSLM